jgi:SagB-type dehydrogenase family enzyme
LETPFRRRPNTNAVTCRVGAWTGRTSPKCSNRYIYLDAGHIAQDLALAAVALGLSTCHIAALYDDETNALLGVDGKQESTLYMSVVGREV